MATEHFSTRYQDLDTWPSLDILSAFYEGQLSAVAAVRPSLPAIAAAAEEAVGRLRRGGRLVYAGAGTSGRIGVQDGTELPPTFNWPDERVVYLIAGGTAPSCRRWRTPRIRSRTASPGSATTTSAPTTW